MRAVNTSNIESDNSNIAQKNITSASAARNLSITVTPSTPPTLKTTSTTVYDVLFQDGGRVLGRQVGTAPLGTSCNGKYPTNTNYFPVPRTSVSFTRTSRSNTVVARCASS